MERSEIEILSGSDGVVLSLCRWFRGPPCCALCACVLHASGFCEKFSSGSNGSPLLRSPVLQSRAFVAGDGGERDDHDEGGEQQRYRSTAHSEQHASPSARDSSPEILHCAGDLFSMHSPYLVVSSSRE